MFAFFVYSSVMKRNKMKNLKIGSYSYWVNKKSGTIHHVSVDKGYDGKPKLFNSTMNLQHERCYFFRGDGVDKFFKNLSTPSPLKK